MAKKQPKTEVDVRIAVVVRDDGTWVAYGETKASDDELICSCEDTLGGVGIRDFHVIALTLPVPSKEKLVKVGKFVQQSEKGTK